MTRGPTHEDPLFRKTFVSYAIYLHMQQLELFPFEPLTVVQKQHIYEKIRVHYWYIRNCRKNSMHDARRRKFYRLIEAEKKRLLMAGVPKREILDWLACCRLTCGKRQICPFCKGEYRPIYQRLQHLLHPANQASNFA